MPSDGPDLFADEAAAAMAERVLDEARRSGDRAGEVAAMIDLGATLLKSGQTPRATEVLHRAVVAARAMGDPAKKADAMTNFAIALLASRRPRRAKALLQPALSYARAIGDRFAEKYVLEHLSLAQFALKERQDGLASLEESLAMASELGDGRQEAKLLWRASVAQAEDGHRQRSIELARASIAVLVRMGDPTASWYEHHLGQFLEGRPMPAPDPGENPFAGSLVASAATAVPAPTAGPGLLRMALTAARAMKTFVGSGLKTSPAEVRRARLEVCSSCEHHTGVRCRICGCITPVKAKMLHERCPIGRWPS